MTVIGGGSPWSPGERLRKENRSPGQIFVSGNSCGSWWMSERPRSKRSSTAGASGRLSFSATYSKSVQPR